MGEIATWLQTLFGLKLTFEGIEEKALLEVDARECTLGAFIDQLAKDRGVGWWYDQGTVHFSPTPPRDAARDVEPVLEELKRIERGKVRFGKGELAQAVPQGESLPDDVALLEEKAKKAVIKMDYTLAEKCCGKLREKVSEPVQKEKWQRMEEKPSSGEPEPRSG